MFRSIQSANSHVRRLVNEKAAHEKDMEEAKEKFKQALSGILIQCEWKSQFCQKGERALHLVITLSTQEPGLQSHPVSRRNALFCLVLSLYCQMPELWFHGNHVRTSYVHFLWYIYFSSLETLTLRPQSCDFTFACSQSKLQAASGSSGKFGISLLKLECSIRICKHLCFRFASLCFSGIPFQG